MVKIGQVFISIKILEKRLSAENMVIGDLRPLNRGWIVIRVVVTNIITNIMGTNIMGTTVLCFGNFSFASSIELYA